MPQFPFKWPPVTQIVTVICIIGFMAAILFPVFHVVHRRDGRFTCVSDMKQLGFAYTQYEQDSDSVLPSGVNANGNGWAGQLYPYTRSKYVYHCPDDGHEESFISYAEKRNLVRHRVGDFGDPPATIVLYEFSTPNCDPSQPETVSATGLSAPQNSARHNDRTFALNFLSADGHVKMLLPTQVSGGPHAVAPEKLPQGIVKTFAVR